MARYDADIAMVLRTLARDGGPVTWRRLLTGTVDADEPWKDAGQTSRDITVNMVIFPASMSNTARKSPLSRKRADGSRVEEGLLIAYMGAVSFEPSLKDIVIRSGVEHEILSCDPLSPNGQNILYQLQLIK